MTREEFMEINEQKEKELFNPILSGSCDNINLLERLSASFISTIEMIQKKEGGLDKKALTNVIAAMLTSWELRNLIKDELI